MPKVAGALDFSYHLATVFSLESWFCTRNLQDQATVHTDLHAAALQPTAQPFIFFVRSGDSKQLPWHSFT